MKKISIGIIIIALLSGCVSQKQVESENSDIYNQYPQAQILKLNGKKATLAGNTVKEYDYVWSLDPSMDEPVYNGSEPDRQQCYIAHDIIYYPQIDENCFELKEYDGEREWVTHYTKDNLIDYIFSTLPVSGNKPPIEMMHSAEEAYDNPVLHITQPGEYILEGQWNGQILIDLGDKDDCFNDEEKKVTLILNNVDVTCSVAPAVIFYSLYEYDNEWEERQEAVSSVDLSNAGAKIVLVDGTENNFTGANVYRLLKPKYKNENTKIQKKLYKLDGAFYSYVSMAIYGNTGIMNINSTTFEGLDSELHLTINGGYINIVAQNDGINVNEDHISVFTMNSGRLTIFAGQGAEGDVIDSNGYININGGIVLGASPSVSDNMLDSDDGTYVSNEATVIENLSGIGGGFQPEGRPENEFGPGDMPGWMNPADDRPEGNPFGPGNNSPEGNEQPPQRP